MGRGHQVKVCSERVCQGHLLCKVSYSKLSQVQTKLNFDVNVDGQMDERTDGQKFGLLYRTLL